MRRASIFLFLCLLGSSASAIATFEALRYEGPTKVYLDSLKEFLTPLSPAQPFLRTLEENPQSAAVLADCFPYSEIEKARALPTPESKLEQWTMMQASVRQRLERDIAESGQLDLESSFLLLDEIHAHYQAYLDEASRAELETAWRKASGEIMDSMLAQADELTRHDPASSDGLPFDIMLSGGRGYGHLAAGLSPAQSRALTDALRHMVAASKFEPTYRERWLEGQPGPGGEELEHTAQASAHTQAAARLKHFFLAALRLHILAARVPGVTTHYEFNSLLQGLGDFPPSTSTEQAMLVRKLLQIIDIVLPYVRNHVMQIGDPGVLAVSAADLEKRVTSLLDISPWVKRSSALAFWLGSMPQRQASLSRSFHEEFPLLKPMAVRAVIAKDYASVREPLRFENNAAGIEDAASPNYAVLSYGDASHPRRARLLTDGIQFITDKDGHRLAVELFTSLTGGIGLRVHVPAGQEEYAKQFFARMEEWAKKRNPYRNQVLRFSPRSGTFQFDKSADAGRLTFDDLVASPPIKEALRAIPAFFSHRAQLKKAGLRAGRFLLSIGPPGSGKSFSSKVLISQLRGKATIILLDARSLTDASSVTAIFGAARALRPSLIIIEDIDLLGVTHRDAGRLAPTVLHALLQEISGSGKSNEGIAVYATSNTEKFDPALTRGLRFDLRIFWQSPSLEERREFLARVFASVNGSGELDLDEMARATKGLVISDLEAIRNEMLVLAAESASLDEEGIAPVTMEHFRTVLAHRKRQREEEQVFRRAAARTSAPEDIGFVTDRVRDNPQL